VAEREYALGARGHDAFQRELGRRVEKSLDGCAVERGAHDDAERIDVRLEPGSGHERERIVLEKSCAREIPTRRGERGASSVELRERRRHAAIRPRDWIVPSTK
jgi:hypothetical protein